jgi:enoyl-CoA hydratase
MTGTEAADGRGEPGPAVIIERRGPALWARMSRPERGNACGPDTITGLREWLSRADEDGLRALVLTGSGSSFCAGADMRAGAAYLGDTAALARYIRAGRDLVDAIAEAPLPVVAAVNGVALAGGFELVQAADVVVAERRARFGDAHARYGVVPGWGSSARLPRLVGPKVAAHLLLTGTDMDAEAMHRLGLVSVVAADGQLERAVDELVAQLPADGGTRARLLRLARGGGYGSLGGALAREWQELTDQLSEPGLLDGVRRFVS